MNDVHLGQGSLTAATIKPSKVKPRGALKCNSAKRTGHGSLGR